MSPAQSPPPRVPWFRRLGPGLITGAADDDPSGIATYSQAGAQFGVNMLWTVVLTYPLMTAIQIDQRAHRPGHRRGPRRQHGARCCRARWSPCIVLLLFVANTVNIGADLAAMGAAAELVLGWGERRLRGPVRGRCRWCCRSSCPTTATSHVLKWLTLALFAYVGVVFTVTSTGATVAARHVLAAISTGAAVRSRSWSPSSAPRSAPTCSSGRARRKWRTRRWPAPARCSTIPRQAPAELGRIAWDTYVGMAFSNLIAFFIILTTAVTLHTAGITDIQTSAEAAEALRPIAGEFAFLLFSLGIIGTGLLALPVLAGSAAYAIGELRGWRIGLEQRPREAERLLRRHRAGHRARAA